MIRVLLVDDHPIVREGLISTLEDQGDVNVVAAVGSAEEALTRAMELRPDVILLDLELPAMSGVQAISRLLGIAPSSKVVVFTAYATDELVLGAIRAGAKGYLLKGASAEEIGYAIHTVHRGGSHLAPDIAARVLSEACAPAASASGRLTEREREVLHLLCQGHSNKRIARALSISERTVKFHLTSLFTKLGAANRTQAVSLAVEHGLL